LSWYSSSGGRPGKFRPPLGVHYAITAGPKEDSLASFSARVDTFDTILSFLFFSSTFATGICLDLLVGEDGRGLCAGFFLVEAMGQLD